MVGAAASLPETRVVGIDVDADPQRVAADVSRLAAETAPLAGVDPVSLSPPEVAGGHAGPAYGAVTAATRRAIALFARTEGLVLDPVYSGKAAAGLMAMAGSLAPSQQVIFVHTGGAPGLFAHRADLSAHLAAAGEDR